MSDSSKDVVLLGLDFGTTNSVAALVLPDGGVTTLSFEWGGGHTETFRSVLYAGPKGARFVAGPMAIDEYLQAEVKGRLIQSIKSFAHRGPSYRLLFTGAATRSKRWPEPSSGPYLTPFT